MLATTRPNDNDLECDCFVGLAAWRSAPSSTIAGAQKIYQLLLRTKIYHQRKTGLNPSSSVTGRISGKSQDTMEQILEGCIALT